MDSPQPPLDLQWVFGVSSDVRGGVVDLRTGTSKTIAYAAGHILVIYDRSQHQQKFLQGHVHQIHCLSACPKKRFIASADCGPDAILIVWNSTNGQHCLQINKGDQDEFLTNGKESVCFWKCFKDVGEPNKSVGTVLKREQAMAKTVEVQKSICEFTLSSFVPSSNSAITGMISGEVIVWQEPRSPFFKEPSKPFSSVTSTENRKEDQSARRMHAVKIVRLHHSPITHLSVWDNYVVTGGSDGYVRFYDPHLGLVGWFEELQAGEITSISFSAMDDYKKENTGLTLEVPPFVLGTKKGHVLLLHAAIFEEQPGSLQHKCSLGGGDDGFCAKVGKVCICTSSTTTLCNNQCRWIFSDNFKGSTILLGNITPNIALRPRVKKGLSTFSVRSTIFEPQDLPWWSLYIRNGSF